VELRGGDAARTGVAHERRFSINGQEDEDWCLGFSTHPAEQAKAAYESPDEIELSGHPPPEHSPESPWVAIRLLRAAA
jgi:hypothetical protein